MQSYEFEYKGQQLILDALKAVFWKEESMLLLSDVHLGKAGHFRKHGIAVPMNIHEQDFKKMDFLIDKYQPKDVVFLGDLFHSDINAEWQSFIQWMHRKSTRMILIRGNHDILPDEVYKTSKLDLLNELILGPFLFTHEKTTSELYNISGHVHPAVRLKGKAKQGVSVPCFYFSNRFGLLPAFGSFTGTYKIKPLKSDQVFAATGEEVVALMP
ncbi:unnamed protein product [Chrysoparadoxa australica]